jgi:hypothetical protein
MTMRLFEGLISFLVAVSPAWASFEGDVVRRSQHSNSNRRNLLNNALLDVALPLADYENLTGIQLSDRRLQQGDDFATVDGNAAYSLTGYSMKYSKCQPVQHFSEDALKAGEVSPMVTDDIVILRLCPQKSCSTSESYGCHYNYAEFALTLSEYTTIMLKYSAYERDSVCDWCATCIENAGRQRRLANDDVNAAAAGDDANQGAVGDDAAHQAKNNDDAAANAAQGDDAGHGQQQQQQDDDAEVMVDDKYVYQGSCQDFDTYCSDYASQCQNTDDAYLDYEGYLDYMDCSEVRYNGYAYFLKPVCDASSGAIKMAVYYDTYCIQSAGSDVSIKNLGLGFKDGFFEKFYSSSCLDCSASVSTH